MYLVDETDGAQDTDKEEQDGDVQEEITEREMPPEASFHALAGDSVPQVMRVEGKLKG